MPSAPSPLPPATTARLQALGQGIRAQRRHLRISASSAAEAAGMSRVTLHRIERGEPSVTMGAYLSAAEALGLSFGLAAQPPPSLPPPPPAPCAGLLPEAIAPADYPQLRRLAWSLRGLDTLTPAEALAVYERNWRHVDAAALDPRERALIDTLAATLGGGRLLV